MSVPMPSIVLQPASARQQAAKTSPTPCFMFAPVETVEGSAVAIGLVSVQCRGVRSHLVPLEKEVPVKFEVRNDRSPYGRRGSDTGVTATPSMYTILPPSQPETSSIRIVNNDSQTYPSGLSGVFVRNQKLMTYRTTTVRLIAMCTSAVLRGSGGSDNRSMNPGM